MSNKYTRRSSSEWSALVIEYRAGSLSRSEFCEQHSISASSLSKWSKRFDEKSTSVNSNSNTSAGFIPIKVKQEAAIESDTAVFSPLKISNNHISVEFTQGCKPFELSQVMGLLNAS